MAGQYTGARQQRSILPIVAIVIGAIALLIGAVTLAVASESKPTLENALSSPQGDLLTQEAYERVRNFGIAVLVIGGLSLGGGILAIVRRSSGPAQPVAYGYRQPQPQPVVYGYQQPQPVQHGYQPQQWQAPPPVHAPPAPPPGARPAPPPDASQRVG